MSPGLAIVLIIVLWLLILAPVLLRGQKPMSRTGEAFDDTRVLFEGDSGELESKRGPKLSAKAARIKARKEAAEADSSDSSSSDADEENTSDDAAVTAGTAGSADAAETTGTSKDNQTSEPQTIASAAARLKAQYDSELADDSQSDNSDSTTPATDNASADNNSAAEEAETIEGEVVEDDSFSASSQTDAERDAANAEEVIDAEIVDEESVAPAEANAVPATAVLVDEEDELLDEEDDILLEDAPREKSSANKDGAETLGDGVAASEGQVFTAPAKSAVAEDAYDLDDTYLSPVDMMYPGAVDAELEEDLEKDTEKVTDSTQDETNVVSIEDGEATDAEQTDEPQELAAEIDEYGDEFEADGSYDSSSDSELSEEELEFAQSRVGRGGWDPEADAVQKATRYQRRQRTLLGLAGVVVLTVALGIIFGGWLWWTAAIAGGLTIAYLVALRTQVRQEQQLRQRRIAQLRRARLGVRSAHDEELAIPRSLRRPGAVIVEIDDNSPDWDHLPEIYEEHEEVPHPPVTRRQRRDDLAARRVG